MQSHSHNIIIIWKIFFDFILHEIYKVIKILKTFIKKNLKFDS